MFPCNCRLPGLPKMPARPATAKMMEAHAKCLIPPTMSTPAQPSCFTFWLFGNRRMIPATCQLESRRHGIGSKCCGSSYPLWKGNDTRRTVRQDRAWEGTDDEHVFDLEPMEMDAECNGEMAAPWANPRTDSDDAMSLCHLLQSVGFVPSRLKENWHQTNSHHAMVHRHLPISIQDNCAIPGFLDAVEWVQHS